MHSHLTRLILACSIAIVICSQLRVSAAHIRIHFQGVVTSAERDAEAFFNVGDAVTGSFDYESATPTLYPDDTSIYEPLQYPNHGSVTIGSYTALFRSGGKAYVFDDIILNLPAPTVADQFTANPYASGPILKEMRPRNLNFNVVDDTANYFNGSALPTYLPPPSEFFIADWVLVFISSAPNNTTIPGRVLGNITAISVEVVPEPNTVAALYTNYRHDLRNFPPISLTHPVLGSSARGHGLGNGRNFESRVRSRFFIAKFGEPEGARFGVLF